MGLIIWAEGKAKRLKFWDFAVLKTALIILGMIIGAYFAVFVKQYVTWFVVAWVVLYTYLLFRMFGK